MFSDDVNAPAGTGEVTSMAGDDKAPGTVTIPADQWAAFQAFQAGTRSAATPEMVFPMASPTVPADDVPSKAEATVASGVVPDTLPIPAAAAPLPTDTDALIRTLMERISGLERLAQQQAAAAGIPANPVEAAFKNLFDHIGARANANPYVESIQSLAKTANGLYADVQAGRVVDDKAWGNLKLDIEDLTPLFRNHELSYLPELVRAIDRARLNAQ